MSGFGERSIAAVLGDIAGNVREMVRAEIRLAKVEAATQVGSAIRGAVFAAAGGGVALVALTFIAIAGMYALATVVALWAAALIVAGIAAVIGGVLIATGLKQMQKVSFALPKTVATIKEDIQWAKPSTR
jgi:hypothetical protein